MSDLTLKELVDLYLQRYAYKCCKTAGAIEATINKHAAPLFSRKLSEITIDTAEQLHRRVGKTSPIQSNRVIQALKAAWNKGIRWQLCTAPNPFALVERFPERSRNRRLSPSEVQQLLQLLQKRGNRDLHDLVMLALFTGVRRGNLLSMQWKDLRLEDKMWIIPETKNGTPQLVPLGVREVELLRARKNATPWVFPAKEGERHICWLYKSWRSLIAAAGIPYATPHDLRRSLAAAMADLNISATVIQSAMNHKSLATTLKVYAIAGKQAELEARQLVQQVWLGELPEVDISEHLKDNWSALVAVLKKAKESPKYFGLICRFPLRKIASEGQYKTAKRLCSKTKSADHLADDERNYFETLQVLIAAYEQEQRTRRSRMEPHELLKQLMQERGLTLRATARLTIPQSTLSEFLSGKRRLSQRNIQRLADGLDVDPKLFMPKTQLRRLGEALA